MQKCRDCEWFIDLKHEDENEVYDGLCCCPDLRKDTKSGAPYSSAKGEWEACNFFGKEKEDEDV